MSRSHTHIKLSRVLLALYSNRLMLVPVVVKDDLLHDLKFTLRRISLFDELWMLKCLHFSKLACLIFGWLHSMIFNYQLRWVSGLILSWMPIKDFETTDLLSLRFFMSFASLWSHVVLEVWLVI